MIVKHVCALRAMGVRAYVLYIPRSQEIKRVTIPAPIILHRPSMRFLTNDIVVIPENFYDIIKLFATINCQKIIYCQSPFQIFQSFSEINSINNMGYRNIISDSNDIADILRYSGCHLPIWTITPYIDPIFNLAKQIKKQQIAFMPAIDKTENILMGLLKSCYPQLKEIPWLSLDNMNQNERMMILNESAIFASFNTSKVFDLLTAEAIVSECTIVSFDYEEMQDITQKNNYFDYIHRLANILQVIEEMPSCINEIKERDKQTINQYSVNTFEIEFKTAWKKILGESFNDYLLESN
jgi:hypothetical protein